MTNVWTESLQAFDTWMNGGGPLYISAAAIVYVALAPVFVLVHELGHAAVALLRTDGRVHVQVGKTAGYMASSPRPP